MKTFIVAAFAALTLASGVTRNAAPTACENPMPIKVFGNAETKAGETLTSGDDGAASLSPEISAQLPETASQSPEGAASAQSPEGAASAQSPLKLPLVNPRVVVSKSNRQLALYAGGAVVRTYRIALGANPSGDKVRQGDRATPEGDFYICVKNAHSNFYLSLGLSYPNAEDAERGLRDKLITRAERDRIVRAIQNKRRPPWNTALGGEIFIHGGGTDGDWTWGCIALANADIKELFDALPMGTPVQIKG